MTDLGEHADGRRSVGLYRPFKSAGRLRSEVTFKPATYGHLVGWQMGQYGSANLLLQDLTGLTDDELFGLRRPDDERVLGVFLEHIHPAIRADIEAGIVPVAQPGVVPRTPGAPPAPAVPGPEPEAGSFADMAQRAIDRAEAAAAHRTAEQDAEELRLSEEADALDADRPPGYAGAFGPE